MNLYIVKGKALIMLSFSFLLLAFGLEIFTSLGNVTFNDLEKGVKKASTSTVEVAKANNTILNNVFKKDIYNSLVRTTSIEEVKNIKASKILTNEDIWHLPVRNGEVTTNPNYYHVAYDITSPNGSNEDIYPVSDGVVSDMFQDYAGALIITILHNIDGKFYTSEYVHLSRYADGLYIGKKVSINDTIGKMGQTGMAYGVHLHFALVDCNLYNDSNCSNIGSFYNYASRRFNEGFIGLGSLINVPARW